MGSNGLVALIWTFHEASLMIGVFIGALVALIYALVFRRHPAGRLFAGTVLFFVGTTLVANYLAARVYGVSATSLDTVRIADGPGA